MKYDLQVAVPPQRCHNSPCDIRVALLRQPITSKSEVTLGRESGMTLEETLEAIKGVQTNRAGSPVASICPLIQQLSVEYMPYMPGIDLLCQTSGGCSGDPRRASFPVLVHPKYVHNILQEPVCQLYGKGTLRLCLII